MTDDGRSYMSQKSFPMWHRLFGRRSIILVKIEIQDGKLKGTTGLDYYGGKFFKFLGIPYGKAPIGDLRFKAPQPVDPWTGIRDATKEGPECPSSDMYFAYYIGQEDNCLNLNVYTKELPNGTSAPKKAVMVWVHGGAFTMGSNKSELFGPDYLMTQDIVLVTINYRLGMLGFSSFKDPSIEVPGNAGLKDQRLALQWVQKNISSFGGDPDNVSIFGESAGAASVHYLTLSPTTKGLFHKAISQSGTALNNWAWGKNNAGEIAKCMGYKDTDEKKIFEKLKREHPKSMVNGLKKYKEHFQAGNVRPWGPVVEPPSEHAFLTESPEKIIRSKDAHKVPMIIGYNSGEGIFYELVRKTVPGLGLPKNLEHDIPYELGIEPGTTKAKEVSDEVKKAYFGDGDYSNENDIDKLYTLKGDTNFIHSIHRTLRLETETSPHPVYAYRMSLVGPLNYFHTFALTKYFKTAILCSFLTKMSPSYLPIVRNSVQGMITKLPKQNLQGVVHADDLLYLFPTFYTPPIKKGSEEDLYIQRFVKMWTNFAKYGDPTPSKEDSLNNVKWKPATRNNLELLDIGKELSMIQDVDGERVKFWDKLYEAYLKV